jgi:hypothetical protein
LKAENIEQTEQWMGAIKKYIINEGDIFNKNTTPNSNVLISFISNVEKEGYLIKSGQNGRNFKKRWCVLKEKIIYYFKTEKDPSNGAPLGVIPLQDSTIETMNEKEKSRLTLLIHTRHRTFKLISDIQIINEWKEAILNCMKKENVVNKRGTMALDNSLKYFSISCEEEKIQQRSKKIYNDNHFPLDNEADVFIEDLLKSTKYHSPDDEIEVWKNYLALLKYFFFSSFFFYFFS